MRCYMIFCLFCAAFVAPHGAAFAHGIYEGVHGKNGQLCCGGNDCAATTYKLEHGRYLFMTREDAQAGDAPASHPHWVEIPEDRITFLPVPGDRIDYSDENHHANLCYRLAMPSDHQGASAANVFDNIFFYCAFVPPGGF